MKIAIYYPPQEIVAKDLLFCKYTDHEFMGQGCSVDTDLIYAASVSVLPQAVAAKIQFNKPLVCWCWDIPYDWRQWDMSVKGFTINAHRDIANEQTAKLLRKCDLVISASKWTQNVLKNEYNISSEQIYFYIDTHGFDAIANQKKEKRIIQISRYFYNKKFETSIVACKGFHDYQLFLIGTGLNSDYGHELLMHSKFSMNVKFNDNISRKKTIKAIKKSTVLVSPSVFEGWGITPVEALYCKVPILLSDLNVFKEVYGDNILYHKKNDPEDMKEKLEKILSDKNLQNKIVSSCQPIIADFTPKKFAKRWEKIIGNI